MQELSIWIGIAILLAIAFSWFDPQGDQDFGGAVLWLIVFVIFGFAAVVRFFWLLIASWF